MCVVLLDPKTYTSSVSGYLVLKVLLAKRKAREVDWSKNERTTGRAARKKTLTPKVYFINIERGRNEVFIGLADVLSVVLLLLFLFMSGV